MKAEQLKTMTLAQIAKHIVADWKNPYFGAKPYIVAMSSLHSDDESYGAESARDICLYFLCNAQSWRGEVARAVKADLKRRFNIK